jgi:hypothetical protein
VATLYKTKSYARSEIGRALSECSQFAHVPILQIFEHLDKQERPLSYKMRIVDELNSFAPAFSAETCLWEFSAHFGTLCPLCLCPIKHPYDSQELWSFRADKFRNKPFLPSWLTLHTHDEFQPIHDECQPFAYAIECIGSENNTRQRDGAFMIKPKRFLADYEKMVAKKDRPHLRFNPRNTRHTEPEYYQPIRTWGTEWRDGDIRTIS